MSKIRLIRNQLTMTCNRLLLLILNIVMQTQVISNKSSPISNIRRFNIKCDFSNSTRKENRIMIIKSLSANQNQSLCVKSLFKKVTHSAAHNNKTANKLFSEQPIVQKIFKQEKEVNQQKKNLHDCQKQLRHFRNLQKSDIFFKINEIQRKISREIKNAKQRENRRYIRQTKTNKTKSKSNKNSINLSDIPAIIKIKNMNDSQPLNIFASNKIKTCTSFHQTRLLNLINQRFLREDDPKPISTSHFIKLNKTNQFQNKKQVEEFSAWDAQSEYDF